MKKERIEKYLLDLKSISESSRKTEHSYRPILVELIKTILPDLKVINEPGKVEIGSPDIGVFKNDLMIGFIETKNIGDTDLSGQKKSGNKEQITRYKRIFPNLIVTDFLRFRLYRDSKLVKKIEVDKSTSWHSLILFFEHFSSYSLSPISTVEELANKLAVQTKELSLSIKQILENEKVRRDDSIISNHYSSFKKVLFKDITERDFADTYAQMITYGLFIGRLNFDRLKGFSRSEADKLIPKNMPFIRTMFTQIAGVDIDDRIKWLVDQIASIFSYCDLQKLLNEKYQEEDPVLHFYEPFLKKYNPEQKKGRGVWYTPTSVVRFIIKSVNKLLQEEFDIVDGLSNYTKNENGQYKVQILDPSTGTGTFLIETIKQIYQTIKATKGSGVWNNYFGEDNHLIQRIYGFEILPASYCIAHLKLNLLLNQLNTNAKKRHKANIVLTDTLAPEDPDMIGTIFSTAIKDEIKIANKIKAKTSIMCVIGNPPYSKISLNRGEYAQKLVKPYKEINKRKLNHKKDWLTDDYVKFIAFGQKLINKNKHGILAFVNNNGWLSNTTFNGMRWNLLTGFDKIYILNLHGDITKTSDSDENVFDIKQGVCINIFVKSIKSRASKKSSFAKVYYKDLKGKRDHKFKFLSNTSIQALKWEVIKPRSKDYFLVPKDYTNTDVYEKGFCIGDLFLIKGSPITTGKDKLLVKYTSEEVETLLSDLKLLEKTTFLQKYNLKPDTINARNWTYQNALNQIDSVKIEKVSYRPFDTRYIPYYSKSNRILAWPKYGLMKNLLGGGIGLVFSKPAQGGVEAFSEVFVTNKIVDQSIFYSKQRSPYVAPLYIIKNDRVSKDLDPIKEDKFPNISEQLGNKIASSINLVYNSTNVSNCKDMINSYDILCYVYSVLHSRNYRIKFKEELKSGFPKIPYPFNKIVFQDIVNLGRKLINVHLLKCKGNKIGVKFEGKGNNIVLKKISNKSFENLDNNKIRIWINDSQYFDSIPLIAWNFQIGGYNPASKFLNDRHNIRLSSDDILIYFKIINALTESYHFMDRIDELIDYGTQSYDDHRKI